jgi:hypothetical protein
MEITCPEEACVIEFGGEAEIRGEYADQPTIMKLGSIAACLASTDLLIFIPISAGAAVIGGVGTPASSLPGKYAPFVILAGMLAIGAWIQYMWMGWFFGDRMPGIGRWLLFTAVAFGCAGLSAVAIFIHIWPLMFLCFAAFIPAGLLAYWLLVKIGQAIHGPR